MRISDWSSDVCSSDLGRPKDAIPPLREAVARSHSAPLIAATLGHALIATEDPAHYPEAEKVLKTAVAPDNENPFPWYPLGIVYAARGDQARPALAPAQRYRPNGRAPCRETGCLYV